MSLSNFAEPSTVWVPPPMLAAAMAFLATQVSFDCQASEPSKSQTPRSEEPREGSDERRKLRDDRSRRASLRYEQAIEFVNQGRYEDAVFAFQEAYEIHPHFAVLYNLGLAYEALEQPIRAIDSWERYLADGGAAIPQARRKLVREKIDASATRVARLVVSVEPSDARVSVNGIERAAPSSGIWVRPGVVEVRVEKLGYESQRLQLSVSRGETEQLQVRLESIQVSGPDAAAPFLRTGNSEASDGGAAQKAAAIGVSSTPSNESFRDDDGGSMHPRRWTGIAVGAAGIVAGGAALGIYLHNGERFEEWKTQSQTPGSNRQDLDSLEEDIRRWDLTAAAIAAVGGAAIVGGAVLYLTAPTSESEVYATMSPWSAAIGGTF